MANQNNFTYCEETTRNHQITLNCSKCIQKIDAICKKDGAKNTCFKEEVCLNLDEYETFSSKRKGTERQKTMDFCIGVKSPNDKKNMVLVELRLKYKNINNLRKKELEEKINHSIDILGQTPIIMNHYYFVFSSDKKNEALSRLRRIYSNKSNVYGIDLCDLKQIFFQ